MRKRVILSMAVFFICTFVLLGRLAYIQLACSKSLNEAAQRQQVIPVLHGYSRGDIYDRNMEKMTGTEGQYYYLIHRENCNDEFSRLIALAGGEIAGTKGDDYIVYRAESFQPTINFLLKEKCGAYGFCYASRYADEQTAAHLIGYLNEADGTGASGLEKMYEKRLREDHAEFSLLGNGTGTVFSGIGVFRGERRPALVCTIDKGLQSEIEGIFKEKQLSGAAVVMEPESGQILAMVSSPAFNPNELQNYLLSDGDELVNKAVQGQYPPGSVFKLVVASAALEKDSTWRNFRYTCTGKVRVNGVTLTCDGRKMGHGSLDMEEAFSVSCNGYFAILAEKIGSELIVEMAEEMGLGKTVWKDYPEEASGNLPSYEERSYSGLSNFSVGQGSLLVTPAQVCQMTNIIATGGCMIKPVLVMSQKTDSKDRSRILSEETAETVRNMMIRVMGTGTGASADFPVSVAGKTGSAETSLNGDAVVHGWFSGFFPADNPKYTAVVLIEKGKTGSGSALPVFEQIVDYLY